MIGLVPMVSKDVEDWRTMVGGMNVEASEVGNILTVDIELSLVVDVISAGPWEPEDDKMVGEGVEVVELALDTFALLGGMDVENGSGVVPIPGVSIVSSCVLTPVSVVFARSTMPPPSLNVVVERNDIVTVLSYERYSLKVIMGVFDVLIESENSKGPSKQPGTLTNWKMKA